MNIPFNITRAFGVAAVASALAAIAHAGIERPFHETVDLTDIDSVEVNISAGSISLVGEEREDLQFDLQQKFQTSSESQADEIEQSIKRTIVRHGDRLVIEVEYKNPDAGFWKRLFSNDDGVSFDAKISLPNKLFVKARTNGGNVEAENHQAGIDAHTNGGSIRIRDLAGKIKAHTNGGNIRAEGLSGDVNLHTNGGNITVHATDAAIVAKTNGGGIDVTFEQNITGESELKTNGGNITARLPEKASFELEAGAQGGSVRFKHKGSFDGKTEKNKVSARINGGGPTLDLHTSGGSVEIVSI